MPFTIPKGSVIAELNRMISSRLYASSYLGERKGCPHDAYRRDAIAEIGETMMRRTDNDCGLAKVFIALPKNAPAAVHTIIEERATANAISIPENLVANSRRTTTCTNCE
jgi:hypothetical protein